MTGPAKDERMPNGDPGIVGAAPDSSHARSRPESRATDPAPGYYDISILKAPVWTPEVAAYFFLGGLSAGAFALSRLAERVGGERFARVRSAGSWVAAATVIPCAPLLIVDLGDPKRFHHMLRIFKPQSPMNLGSWALTVYGGVAVASAAREALFGKRRSGRMARGAEALDAVLGAAADYVGLPAALVVAGYTGVLLSTTSTPIWCKNPWLGPLFTAGAASTGCAAIRLVLELKAEPGADSDAERRALKSCTAAAHFAEAAAAAGFVATAGKLAAPLITGRQAREFLGAAVGIGLLAPEVLERLPAPAKAGRGLKILAVAAALIGGFFLRHSIVESGKTSGNDPKAARESSRMR